MGNLYLKRLLRETARFSFQDFLARVATIIFFLIGFALLLHETSFNLSSILGLVFLLVALLLTGLLYYQHALLTPLVGREQIHVLHTKATLRILDTEGRRVEYIKNKHCRVEVDTLRGFTETYLRADGRIENIETGPYTDHSVRIMPDARLAVDIAFRDPIKRGEIYELYFSCIFLDSFTNEREYFTTQFLWPTDSYELIVEFPAERPAKKAWIERAGSTGTPSIITDIEDVRIEKDPSSGNKRIISRCIKPRLYSSQILRWVW